MIEETLRALAKDRDRCASERDEALTQWDETQLVLAREHPREKHFRDAFPTARFLDGYGWEIADVSKIIAAEEVLERLACAQLAAQPAPCDACKRRPGEQNHPAGMIFVGWGRGWEVCGECNGTQVK